MQNARTSWSNTLVFLCMLMLANCATPAMTNTTWLDFSTLQRGARPNQALACSREICPVAAATHAPLSLDASPRRIADALARIEPAAAFRTEQNGDIRARYVAVTRLMRFRDDVDMLIRQQSESQSVVAVYSRSRIGYSDLGANSARIEALERRLRAELAGAR
jgi:uncharacterized protein (DUF1499 family)